LSQCLVLVSSILSTVKQETNQRRTRDLLNAKGVMFEELDASDEKNVVKRKILFEFSGVRSYPQIFLESRKGVLFVGVWEDLEELLEMGSLPQSFLDSHPEVQTFDRIFDGIPR
ncbi:unnamed protein product, partial [Choristocarpus tenellus]